MLGTTRLTAGVHCRYLEGERSFMFRAIFSSSRGLTFIRRTGGTKFFVHVFFIYAGGPRVGMQHVARHCLGKKRRIPVSGVVSHCCGSLLGVNGTVSLISEMCICSGSVRGRVPQLLFHAMGKALFGRCMRRVPR